MPCISFDLFCTGDNASTDFTKYVQTAHSKYSEISVFKNVSMLSLLTYRKQKEMKEYKKLMTVFILTSFLILDSFFLSLFDRSSSNFSNSVNDTQILTLTS